MRAPDNFTFLSLVLLTLCTTRPAPERESSSEVAAVVRRAPVRAPVRVEAKDPRVVLRRPS